MGQYYFGVTLDESGKPEHHVCSSDYTWTRRRLDTIEELEKLPDQAVIYAGDNKVWQHGISEMSPRRVTEVLNTQHWNARTLWVTFGSQQIVNTTYIELPAWLLDDGL